MSMTLTSTRPVPAVGTAVVPPPAVLEVDPAGDTTPTDAPAEPTAAAVDTSAAEPTAAAVDTSAAEPTAAAEPAEPTAAAEPAEPTAAAVDPAPAEGTVDDEPAVDALEPAELVAPVPLTDEPEPVASVGQICDWLGKMAVTGGDPLSVTVTAATRSVYVHLPAEDEYRLWCDRLTTCRVGTGEDPLIGPRKTAVAYVYGWTLYVNLMGRAVEVGH